MVTKNSTLLKMCMNWYKLKTTVNRIAIVAHGNRTHIKTTHHQKCKNTSTDSILEELGKMVSLDLSQAIDLNLDGKNFYTAFNQMYRVT